MVHPYIGSSELENFSKKCSTKTNLDECDDFFDEYFFALSWSLFSRLYSSSSELVLAPFRLLRYPWKYFWKKLLDQVTILPLVWLFQNFPRLSLIPNLRNLMMMMFRFSRINVNTIACWKSGISTDRIIRSVYPWSRYLAFALSFHTVLIIAM